MRRMKLLYSMSRNGLPVLVWAALVPVGESCGGQEGDTPVRLDGASTGGAAGGGGAAGTAGSGATGGTGGRPDASAGSGGVGGIVTTGGAAGAGGAGGRCVEAGGAPPDPRYEFGQPSRPLRSCCEFYVDLPPEGTPAMIDTVCVDSGGPVDAGWAARVTLFGN